MSGYGSGGVITTYSPDTSGITESGGNTVFTFNNRNPIQGETSLCDFLATNVGGLILYTFDVVFDEDAEIKIDFSSALIPNRIVGISMLAVGRTRRDELGARPEGDRQIRFNRSDAIDDDITVRVTMWVN